MAWIATVLRRAAYQMSRDVRRRFSRETPTAHISELSGSARPWEDELIGRLDTAALCSRLTDREGRACRILAAVGPVTERHLARLLGISQPTAHRLKRTLAMKLSPLMYP